MAKHKDHCLELRGNRHPLPELLTLRVTKPTSQFTPFEHLLVGDVLEQFKRIKRASR